MYIQYEKKEEVNGKKIPKLNSMYNRYVFGLCNIYIGIYRKNK